MVFLRRVFFHCLLASSLCSMTDMWSNSASGREINPAELCEAAAARASRQSGVPAGVLQAITLTETGRSTESGMRPWPWAVNVAGQSSWFATRDEAGMFAANSLGMGKSSFDVGCFQINYRWHGNYFPSLDAMFDPDTNALYAANLLRKLRAEKGDWSQAAGAYHSSTPEYADAYRSRFDAIYAGLSKGDLATELPSPNPFPLLQAGSAGTIGSIVPMWQSDVPPLIGY